MTRFPFLVSAQMLRKNIIKETTTTTKQFQAKFTNE
jgi:hypothetical protein